MLFPLLPLLSFSRHLTAWCARLALLGALASPAWAVAGEVIAVQAKRQGSAVQITTQAIIRAPQELIWQTLTDYDRLAEFVPDISTSRVIERQGSTVTVEQAGKAHLWFFTYVIDVVVEVTEQPPHTLAVRVLRGNLKQLEGGYRLDKVEGKEGDEYLLQWSGLIEPALPVPTAVTLPLMRSNIARQFEGMVREIERREARRTRVGQQ
jgi:ribosome-associated toxin RatA of RatAB toxin-antitoxin module